MSQLSDVSILWNLIFENNGPVYVIELNVFSRKRLHKWRLHAEVTSLLPGLSRG